MDSRQGQAGRPDSTTDASADQASDRRTLLDQLSATARRLESEIASRARAEQAALLNEERLKMAMDIAGMGTWDWDIATDDIVWSDNVEEIHGFAPGSFDRRYESWLAVVHPEDQARVGELVGLALSDGDGRYDTELRICRPDSQTRWLHARGQAYYDDDGSPTRMVGTVIDVSERRCAEEELRRANCEAQQAREVAEAASAAKNAFLSRMSHELRTPLNAVLGFAQLLELDVVGDQRESVKHIRKAGHHLLDLINEVLDIARIESGQLSLSPEPVLVAEVVEEAIHLIRPLADVRGLSVSQGSDGAFDRHVVADRQRIKQVLLNLLSNAVKYNRPGGSITIGCAQSPDPETSTSISVRDSGFGIPKDDLDRLFVPFDRLGAENSEVEGSGIGLVLTQRLVEAMGGVVQVSSRVGEGSLFTVMLPTAEYSAVSHEECPEPAPGEAEPAGGTGRTSGVGSPDGDGPRWHLLSIEDNSSNARLLERVVGRRPGWHLTNAAQGRLGLQLARSLTTTGSLDLILLDLHLPDLHGVEILNELRADAATARTPVVVLSADATPGAVRRAMAGGATGFLQKPFVVAELLDILDTLADGRALVRPDEPC